MKNKKNAYMEMLAAYGVTAARPGGMKITNSLFSKHPVKEKSKVLEVGCGLGDTAKKMATEYNANVTAIDIHPKMIEKGKKRHQGANNITWIVGDLHSPLLLNSTFQTVLSESVLSFTNVKESLKLIHDLLEKDGFFYSLEPIYLGGMSQSELEDYKNFYGFSSLLMEDEWKEILVNANFSIVDIMNSYEVLEEGEPVEFPDLLIDEDLGEEHVETFKQHEYFIENYLAYFDYAYFICRKNET